MLGRTNYEGFYSAWPGITRELGHWLDATETVVVSHTLTEAPWENSRIARDLAAEVKTLRERPGRDVDFDRGRSVNMTA